VVKTGIPGCSENLISIDVNDFLTFFLRVYISLPNERMGRDSVLYTFILENFWTKVGLKVFFRIL
jgi:hypothetical protein